METKYYLGYVRNPNEFMNELLEVNETEVILEENGNELKETLTKAKLHQMNPNQVFDGHHVFEENASLIGRIEKEITAKELENYFNNLEIEGIKEYLDKVIRLSRITIKKALISEQEYIEAQLKVLEYFQSKPENLVKPIKK